MRTLSFVVLGTGIFLASQAFAQTNSSSNPTAASKPADQPNDAKALAKPDDTKTDNPADNATAKPGETPKAGATPAALPPLSNSSQAPLPPTAADAGPGALPPPPLGFAEVKPGTLSAAASPPMNLLDLHGYFRMRGEIDNKVDLNLDPRYPYPQFVKSPTGHSTLGGGNMRFRLEPTINISEDVRIMGQIDMLDNIVMGSTPSGFPGSGATPLVFFSDNQASPSGGFNALKDSIQVKRLWGEVMTPVGLLRFGRMGSQWGLGILANDGGPHQLDHGPLVTRNDILSANPFSPRPLSAVGQCFDCDYGSTSDRILFVTKFAGHYIVPMIDFTAEGPYFTRPNESGGQGLDLDQSDDVHSYILAAARIDKPEDIRQALSQDEWVLNYGFYFVFRNQALDALSYNLSGDAASADTLTKDSFVARNAQAYIPDIWVRFLWKKLRLELEAVMVIGKLNGPTLDANGQIVAGQPQQEVSMLQFGGVLQGDYSLLNDKLLLGLELGVASGDESKGFGVNPLQERKYGTQRPDGSIDDNLNNFRFNFDYHVDLILWRQIIGTVTNAIYVKPSLQYNISEALGAKLSVIYSSAIYQESTRGKSFPLGLEFDVDFFYFSSDHFHAGLSYGLLIPFSGMKDLGNDELPGGDLSADKDKDPSLAHRILGRLVLYF